MGSCRPFLAQNLPHSQQRSGQPSRPSWESARKQRLVHGPLHVRPCWSVRKPQRWKHSIRHPTPLLTYPQQRENGLASADGSRQPSLLYFYFFSGVCALSRALFEIWTGKRNKQGQNRRERFEQTGRPTEERGYRARNGPLPRRLVPSGHSATRCPKDDRALCCCVTSLPTCRTPSTGRGAKGEAGLRHFRAHS